jgi:ribosomal-protein-alanine N-acetyltransferase
MSKNFFNAEISTNRFTLKLLNLGDVTQRYADWLNNSSTNQYISSRLSLKELKSYVAERCNRDDVLFLGIFNKVDGLHIGNIKYEPVNTQQSYAVMGILIGDAAWRGKGVACEVILASASWLHRNKSINHIILGVNKSNAAAIRAYQKIGFIEKSSNYLPDQETENTTMILDLNLA